MPCPACGHGTVASQRFCDQCGARLPAGAPGRYTPAPLTQKILAYRVALEGERKQVTVLFADLAGLRGHGEPGHGRRHHGPVRRQC